MWYLPNKHEALSSNPRVMKKQEGREEGRRKERREGGWEKKENMTHT
jgi:hypothetical protein